MGKFTSFRFVGTGGCPGRLCGFRAVIMAVALVCGVGVSFGQGSVNVNFTPRSPKIIAFRDFDPDLGYGVIQFVVSTLSLSGSPLPVSDVSYRLLVNDVPYVYEAVLNPFPDGQMVGEWIPVTYVDYNIKIEDGYHYLFYFFDGTNNLGMETRYVNPETGEEWISSEDNNEIDVVTESFEDNWGRIERYDASGLPMSSDYHGVSIERIVRPDGSVSSRKVLR